MGTKPLAIVISLMLTSGAASAQTLNLSAPPRPTQNTRDPLLAELTIALEAATSDRERSLIRLVARLAHSDDPRSELAARTIARHLDPLSRALREAERLAADPAADPLLRQRLRERFVQLDASPQDDPRLHAERFLEALAQVLTAADGSELARPARLATLDAQPDLDGLREQIAALPERFAASAARLSELLGLLVEVEAVPALERSASAGILAIAGVVQLASMPTDRFIPRVVGNRAPDALERCLSAPRVPDSLAMLEALAHIGTLTRRCANLEGDTARRVEPVLLAMLDRLQSPSDAQMLTVMLPPLERSLGLIARGAALPAPGAVSPQVQFAWRFLLPQEQTARVTAIGQIARIVEDPAAIASPEVVSALVGHAELIESLEALLGVDLLQRELEQAGVPGAFPALEALRVQLRQMGNRTGYREAGGRVLPIVRTLARYRDMPGSDRLLIEREHEPEWAGELRTILTQQLGPLHVQLAMQLIGESTGETTTPDTERLDAGGTLETLRRTIIIAADLLDLADGLDRLDALPEFEVFETEPALGLRRALALDDLDRTFTEVVDALARSDAHRARSLLDRDEDRLVAVGVLAELSRRTQAPETTSAAGRALEAALVWQRAEALGPGAHHLLELSLAGRYHPSGLSMNSLRDYISDQAERTIDTIDWLSEAWQHRR